MEVAARQLTIRSSRLAFLKKPPNESILRSAHEPWYFGREFARRDVVLVSINDRLGAFGFLSHPQLSAESEHGSSGNYGILDQIAALKWVQKNLRMAKLYVKKYLVAQKG